MTDQETRNLPFSSYDFLWLAISLLSLLVIAALLPLTPQDYWWYLRLGQDIARTGAVPSVDAYSFTQTGTPVFYQSWLSALIFYLVYSAGGIPLTFFMRLLILAGTYGLLWILLRRMGVGPQLATILVLLAGLAGSNNWAIRPQLLTYPLFVWMALVLWKWQKGEARQVWNLALISLLWVNLHGSYPLLFLMILPALLFGKGERRKLWLATLAAALVVLVNPHGPATLGYVASMMVSPSVRYSLEWLPAVNRGWQANLFFLWLLIFPLLAALSPRRLTALQWAWFILFGWLGLYGGRFTIWFVFILAVNTTDLLSGWARGVIDRPIQKIHPLPNLVSGMLILILPLLLLPGLRENWWPDAPDPYHGANPVGATDWLADHPEIDGPLWSDFSHSSYLIFMLPARPVWIDPRFELYPVEQWNKYIAISNASLQWQTLLDEQGINLVMLSSGGEPALIRAMRLSDVWCELYRDSRAVIFSRGHACPPTENSSTLSRIT